MHVIKIGLDDLQSCNADRRHGPLEFQLQVLAAQVKDRENAKPVFVRVDFPRKGGLELRCKRGILSSLLWWVRLHVPLWED